MNSPDLAVFKYDYAEPLKMVPAQKKKMCLGLALVALCFYFFIPLGVVALFAFFFFVAKILPKKAICLSPRYLLCGSTVLYYRNIDKIILNADQGNLTLFWDGNKVFKIERDKFPTNARKAPKIAANKAAKFNKMTEKIIAKVRAASPDVELIGVSKS
jgi:hypothetical protein